MTDNLLQKLEEKMMTLLAELENLRKETSALRQENLALKTEYNNHLKKLQGLISLLDSLDGTSTMFAAHDRELLLSDAAEAEYAMA